MNHDIDTMFSQDYIAYEITNISITIHRLLDNEYCIRAGFFIRSDKKNRRKKSLRCSLCVADDANQSYVLLVFHAVLAIRHTGGSEATKCPKEETCRFGNVAVAAIADNVEHVLTQICRIPT